MLKNTYTCSKCHQWSSKAYQSEPLLSVLENRTALCWDVTEVIVEDPELVTSDSYHKPVSMSQDSCSIQFDVLQNSVESDTGLNCHYSTTISKIFSHHRLENQIITTFSLHVYEKLLAKL